MRELLGILIFLLVGCTAATTRMSPSTERASHEAPPKPSANPPLRAPATPAPVVPAGSTPHDTFKPDVRVSKSGGERNGVTILWPRMIPSGATGHLNPQAIALQDHLTLLTETTLVGRPRDVRPSPERVCPQAGCRGISVGVLLVHTRGGCAAVALVTPPGRSASVLVPWIGRVTLKRDMVRFREPPESQVIIRDFVPCAELSAHLAAGDEVIRAALARAAIPTR
jgi:hypothetical protein